MIQRAKIGKNSIPDIAKKGREFRMSPSSVQSSPAMAQINAALAGDITKTQIAYAMAAKSVKVNKEVAQATVDLIKTAAEIVKGSTSGRGIDVTA